MQQLRQKAELRDLLVGGNVVAPGQGGATAATFDASDIIKRWTGIKTLLEQDIQNVVRDIAKHAVGTEGLLDSKTLSTAEDEAAAATAAETSTGGGQESSRSHRNNDWLDVDLED